MNVYTSYYAKLPEIDLDKYTPIRVSKSKPGWIEGIYMPGIEALYPSWSLINDWKNNEITWEQYTEGYLHQLSFVSKEEIMSKLEELSQGKDVILMCWEAKNKECHRHILADWLPCDVQEW